VGVVGADLLAARTLLGLTRKHVAGRLLLSSGTLARIEGGDESIRPYNLTGYAELMRTLEVTFAGPGLVQHPRFGRAPTRAAVGLLSGQRLRDGRFGVKHTPVMLGQLAIMLPSHIRRIEKLPSGLEGADPVLTYRLFNTIERLGYRFARPPAKDFRAPR
jgi:transcriptional regulator with XRE-family HTH domain